MSTMSPRSARPLRARTTWTRSRTQIGRPSGRGPGTRCSRPRVVRARRGTRRAPRPGRSSAMCSPQRRSRLATGSRPRPSISAAPRHEGEPQRPASASQKVASRLSTSSWNRSSSDNRRALPSASEVMSAMPADEPQVRVGEGRVRPWRQRRSRRSRRAPNAGGRPGRRRMLGEPQLRGDVGDHRARDDERLGLARQERVRDLGRDVGDAPLVGGPRGADRVQTARGGRRPSPRRGRRRPTRRTGRSRVGIVSIASWKIVARACACEVSGCERRRSAAAVSRGLTLGLEELARSRTPRRRGTRAPRAAAGPPRRTSP